MVKVNGRWEREHRVIMGLQPGDGKIVHHIDGDKLNNDPRNLRVFSSQSTHNAFHGHTGSAKRLMARYSHLFFPGKRV